MQGVNVITSDVFEMTVNELRREIEGLKIALEQKQAEGLPSGMLSTDQACKYLKVSRTTLWRMVKNKQITPVWVGGVQRFRAKDLI